MEINARIRFDGEKRQLVYSAELVANYVPLYGPYVNIKEQVEILDMAHKAIESVMEKLNDKLSSEAQAPD